MNRHHPVLSLASPRLLILAGTFALLSSGPTPAQIVPPVGPPQPYPETVYVNASATPPGNGMSWATAFTTLDPAISVAVPGAQIWVAQGTYKPLSFTTGFSITKKLKFYGGFLGTESSIQARPQNPPLFLQTVLDGDIGGNPVIYTDNAEHVVTIQYVGGSSGTAGVIIDGFHIRNGYAASPGQQLDMNGGGIYSQCSDLDLANCIIRRNSALNGGGLFFTESCGSGFTRAYTLHVKLCEFGSSTDSVDKNSADEYGGAIYGEWLNGEVVNTTFLQNSANFYGGAVFLWKMGSKNRLDFTNCAFWRNVVTGTGGGAIYLSETGAANQQANAKLVNCTFAQNSTASCGNGTAVNVSTNAIGLIYNSIFWHNYTPGTPSCGGLAVPIVGNPTVEYSDVQNILWPDPGMTNIMSNPQFVSFHPLFDLRLTAISPCLEFADYSRLPFDSLDVDGNGTTGELMPIDLKGDIRYTDDPAPNLPGANTYLDMGAYERQPPSAP